MHEISVASGMLDRALEVAHENGADCIDAMTLEIGPATHVNPDQLVFCLETIATDTLAEGATIKTETIEPVAECDCGWRDTPEKLDLAISFAPDMRCPECENRVELVRGRECRLASIDVPDGAGEDVEQMDPTTTEEKTTEDRPSNNPTTDSATVAQAENQAPEPTESNR